MNLLPSIRVISVVLGVGHRAFGIGLDVGSDTWNAKCPPFGDSVAEPRRDGLFKVSRFPVSRTGTALVNASSNF